jgi:hypothetical protein
MNPTERMLIEWACERLCRQYCLYSDASDWDAMAVAFADDAVFVRPTMPDTEYKGKADILAAFRKRPPITVQHQLHNILIDVQSPTQASGVCTLSFLMAPGTDEALPRVGGPIHFGEFRDRFVLAKDGWKFSERRGRLVLKTA